MSSVSKQIAIGFSISSSSELSVSPYCTGSHGLNTAVLTAQSHSNPGSTNTYTSSMKIHFPLGHQPISFGLESPAFPLPHHSWALELPSRPQTPCVNTPASVLSGPNQKDKQSETYRKRPALSIYKSLVGKERKVIQLFKDKNLSRR